MTDHLALAKEYIAKGEDFYRRAADEIIAARDEDPTLGWGRIARLVGKSETWCRDIVRWRTNPQGPDSPYGGDEQNEARYERHVKTVLKDPERRERAISDLPTEQVEEIIEQAHNVVVDRVRAQRAEHDTSAKAPTVGDLMGDERFDPSESWADTEIIRVREKAHALHRQVEKWGLVLGSMDEEQAFAYLQEAERNIADVRVVLQERMADRSRAEV